MDLFCACLPIFLYGVCLACYCFGAQRPFDLSRWVLLCLLEALLVAIVVASKSCWGAYGTSIMCPAMIISGLYAASMVCTERVLLDFQGRHLSPWQKLRIAYRALVNPRGVKLNYTPSSRRQRVLYVLKKAALIAALWACNRAVEFVAAMAYRRLRISIFEFYPRHETYLPATNVRDFAFQLMLSSQWIWSTYARLTGLHSLLAVVFVGLLDWDAPGEWPSLFGDIREAYSLQRFWGVFWHCLHTQSFVNCAPWHVLLPAASTASAVAAGTSNISQSAKTQRTHDTAGDGPTVPGARRRMSSPGASRPGSPKQGPQAQETPKTPTPERATARKAAKALQAFWVFFLSAALHAATDWAVFSRTNAAHELGFFLANFGVCLVEAAVGPSVRVRVKALPPRVRPWCRVAGYGWVVFVMMSLAPPWQRSLVRNSLMGTGK